MIAGRVEILHEALFSEVTYHAAYEPQRCVRTERYKYIRRFDNREKLVLPNVDDTLAKEDLLQRGWSNQPRHQEMLFDLFFDPDETNNLIGEPMRSPLLDEMRSRLSRWMEETDDPLLRGPIPAPSGARVNDPDGLSWGEPTLLVD